MVVLPSCQQCKRKASEFHVLKCVEAGNRRRVERALANGADIDGVESNIGFPPLVLAATEGLVKMVKLLLRNGANVDAAPPRDIPHCEECDECMAISGTTALHAAVTHHRIDVVRLLLRWGGNPNIIDSEGLSPLHRACDHDEAADAMVMATTLLEGGADPLLGTTDGEIATHFAAGRGHTDLLDLLVLKAPSTLNRPSLDGDTPLRIAAQNGRESMVLHLLQVGAKQPRPEDTEIASPLAAAVEFDQGGVLRILMEAKQDPDRLAYGILEAVICAVVGGRAKGLDVVLGYLEEKERASTASTHPLLHHAVSHGRLDVVSVLLAAGADETGTDNDGRCAGEEIEEDEIDPSTKAALLRMLERGPAYRAAAWRWAAGMSCPVGGAGGTPDLMPSGRHFGPLRVKIFRPRCKKAFGRPMCRSLAR